jgi:hypothetical protein
MAVKTYIEAFGGESDGKCPIRKPKRDGEDYINVCL